jgi:hypothetical protein
MNKVSIYLTDQREITANCFKSVTQLDNDFILTITSRVALTPMDGKVFDYVLSKLPYQRDGIKNLTITVQIDEIIDVFGYVNRTENRRKIMKHIENMVGVEVLLEWNGGKASFEMLESFEPQGDNHSCLVSLSQSFIDAMDKEVAGSRPINISQTMKVQSGYTLELAKILQMRGMGVDKSTGLPLSVKEISHTYLCRFLNLKSDDATTISQIRKSMSQLMQYEYPRYKYSSKTKKWKQVSDIKDTKTT